MTVRLWLPSPVATARRSAVSTPTSTSCVCGNEASSRTPGSGVSVFEDSEGFEAFEIVEGEIFGVVEIVEERLVLD
jgi:hypothetical protein